MGTIELRIAKLEKRIMTVSDHDRIDRALEIMHDSLEAGRTYDPEEKEFMNCLSQNETAYLGQMLREAMAGGG